LVICSVYIDRPGPIVASAGIDVSDGEALKLLQRARLQPETILRIIDEAKDLIELKKSIPGLQLGLLVRILEELMGSGATIALNVRSSHVQRSMPQQRDQQFPS
jgi:ATP-dependent 26S proteasome regulatory subunit